MTTLTPEDRARLRDLAAKATPGPWDTGMYPGDRRTAPYCFVEVGDTEVQIARFEGGHFDAAYIAAADPATVTALLDALDNADERGKYLMEKWSDAEVEAEELAARAARAEAELERLHSWAGLMELLDEHYPADLIPTAPDDPARDAGPRIVSLIRRVDEAEAAVQRVRDLHHCELGNEYGDEQCYGCREWWPCPTAIALDGDA